MARPKVRLDGMEPRLFELLALIAQGYNNKEIAPQMGLTDSTVKEYCTRLYASLGLTPSWGNPRVRAARHYAQQELAGIHPGGWEGRNGPVRLATSITGPS
jgi:DNA-binding NarL/FixJ family response regulator